MRVFLAGPASVVQVIALLAAQPISGLCAQGSARWLDSTTVEAQVYRVWSTYFESKGRDLASRAGTRSPLWVANEQSQWPMYDLAGFYVPRGGVPQVISVGRVPSGEVVGYEIAVRFVTPPSTTASSRDSNAVTASWYATKQAGRWVLANVLPERTRTWQSVTVGQIHYFSEPGRAFDHAKAARAVSFVDSLAAAFGVPRLGPLEYYVTSSVDAALKAIGVEYPRIFGAGGGFAKPVNRQLFAAVPAWGENYRHELVHLVLLPLLNPRTMTIIASEGIATWFGGTAGADLRTSVRNLSQYLSGHPNVSLDSAITPGALPQAESYAAGAVICEMLARHGGVKALKAFLLAGPGPAQVREALVVRMGEPWNMISAEWRSAVDRMAGLPARL